MLRKNMRVICIDAEGAEQLTLNGVYTIRDVRNSESEMVIWRTKFIPMASVWLYEAEPGERFHGFAAARFRPAVERKTDISIFVEMLNCEPVKKHAEVD